MEVESPYSLGARWIFTMLDDPLEDHWINIRNGKVESVSPKPAHRHTQHLGEQSILLPATVNAHAHLELSQLESPLDVPSRSMPDWVVALLAFRRSADYNAGQGIRTGIERLDSTAAVADIVPPTLCPHPSPPPEGEGTLKSPPPLGEGTLQSPLPGGSHVNWTGRVGGQVQWLPFAELIAWRKELLPGEIPRSFGLSPHAPQTVCPTLLEQAVSQQVPIAMHLAETQEELQLLRHHTGPLVEMMRRADADYDPKSVLLGKRPMDYLQLLSAAPSVFVIHGNYLDDEELRFLASHRETMSVVYCPRSHAYFRHSAYPLQKMLDYGVRVLLGTDSLASVPDLSLVEEMRWVLKQHPTILPETVYRMGTLDGAFAFHLLQEGLGTIQPGCSDRLAYKQAGDEAHVVLHCP
ncbi:MAG: amidohydrolase family protein [Planctomycetaceae bacterium]|jgi:cytosine/adenosine deaminase-related metal-dependent hydrolase|nr:amidohydrolase family protein [Planctomycetaceae bacterium]